MLRTRAGCLPLGLAHMRGAIPVGDAVLQGLAAAASDAGGGFGRAGARAGRRGHGVCPSKAPGSQGRGRDGRRQWRRGLDPGSRSPDRGGRGWRGGRWRGGQRPCGVEARSRHRRRRRGSGRCGRRPTLRRQLLKLRACEPGGGALRMAASRIGPARRKNRDRYRHNRNGRRTTQRDHARHHALPSSPLQPIYVSASGPATFSARDASGLTAATDARDRRLAMESGGGAYGLAFTTASIAINSRIKPSNSLNGTMLGPSEGALSGS